MKRIICLCVFLGLSCAWASAQNGKVVTPHTVNPEAVVVDSLQAGTGTVALKKKSSDRWYFGLGGGCDYSSTEGWYFDVCPDIAYRVNKSLYVGGRVSYTYLAGSSMAGVIPYSRIHLVPLGKMLTAYVSLEAPCYFWSDFLHLGAWARPGLGFRISDGAYVLASYGVFGYSYIQRDGVSGSGWVSRLDSDSVSIGVYFNL